MTISAEDFNLINGGVLQLSLLELNPQIVPYFSGGSVRQDLSSLLPYNIQPWFQNKGEILFFKKPSLLLDVQISTDYSTYKPGDQVNFQIDITNLTSGEPIAYDKKSNKSLFVSVYVTDESVFDNID